MSGFIFLVFQVSFTAVAFFTRNEKMFSLFVNGELNAMGCLEQFDDQREDIPIRQIKITIPPLPNLLSVYAYKPIRHRDLVAKND